MNKKYSRKPLRIPMVVAICIPVLLAGINKRLQIQAQAPVVVQKPAAVKSHFPEPPKPAATIMRTTVLLAAHKKM